MVFTIVGDIIFLYLVFFSPVLYPRSLDGVSRSAGLSRLPQWPSARVAVLVFSSLPRVQYFAETLVLVLSRWREFLSFFLFFFILFFLYAPKALGVAGEFLFHRVSRRREREEPRRRGDAPAREQSRRGGDRPLFFRRLV